MATKFKKTAEKLLAKKNNGITVASFKSGAEAAAVLTPAAPAWDEPFIPFGGAVVSTEELTAAYDSEIVEVTLMEEVVEDSNITLRDDRDEEVVVKRYDSKPRKKGAGTLLDCGIRLYKSGTYAAERLWHAYTEQGLPVFCCETVNLDNGKFLTTGFNGETFEGSRLDGLTTFARALAESNPEQKFQND